MKSITAKSILLLLIILSACGDDPKPGISKNTWTLKPEGHSTGTYRKKTITLSTQTYQVVE